jgi:hypothetical protein
MVGIARPIGRQTGGLEERMHSRVRIVIAGSAMAAILALSSVLTVSAAPVRFGAKLTNDTQPQTHFCDTPNDTPPHADCTWILNEAHQRGDGGIKAPKAGTIGRVRLMSCTPGNFRVQVARKVPGTSKYKVRKNGPSISYQGDVQGCGDDDDFVYRIESFATNFTVLKGDRIAIKAKKTGTLRCGGGGDNTLLFAPPLVAGGNAKRPADFGPNGCLLLVEWQYK